MEELNYAQQVIDFQKTTIITMFDLAAKAQDLSEKTASQMLDQVFTDPESLKTYNTLVDAAKKCRTGARELINDNYNMCSDYIENLSNRPAHS